MFPPCKWDHPGDVPLAFALSHGAAFRPTSRARVLALVDHGEEN